MIREIFISEWTLSLSILIQNFYPCPNHITFGCPVVTTDISLIKLVNKLNICQEDRARKSFVHILVKKTHLSASCILKLRLLVISSTTLFSVLYLTRSEKSCLNSGISLAHHPPYAPKFYWMLTPNPYSKQQGHFVIHFIEQSVRSWTSGLDSSYSSF